MQGLNKNEMKVALLQINPTVGDLEGNSRKIKEGARKARAQGADLVVTSELSLLGYPPRDLLLYPSFINKAFRVLEKTAKDTAALPPILVGTAVINKSKKGRPLYNTAAFLKNGKIESLFYKSLLPTYDVFDEDRYFEPVDTPQILNFSGKKIGISICEDLWNDCDFWERPRYHFDPIEKLAREKVDFIVNLSSSPFTVNKQKFRESMISASCRKYKTPIIYVNQVGGNDELIFDGASVAFDSKGKIFARAKAFLEDVITVDSEGGKNKVNAYPKIKEEAVFKSISLGLFDYLKKCGFGKVIVGISGGIDSAVVATFAKETLGPKNVIGVLMPSSYTSSSSLEDAKKLTKNLGIKAVTIGIENLMAGYDRSLKDVFRGSKKDVTEENIQARIRGNILMAISNKYKVLLLSTGNKSELTVGYTTLYGDLTGGLAVIGDLPKTQVYKMAKWFNRKKEIIPKTIIDRAPSAELRPFQKDKDSLPPYSILDKILYLLVEQQESLSQIVKRGFKKDLVSKVLKMVTDAEFKRRQAPPVLKISERAFGSGWRMPIAAESKFFD